MVSAAPALRHKAAIEASAASASQGPVALLDVLGLRLFERVEGPEQREQTLVRRGGLRQKVGRVNDQDGVELEADRVGLDVADAGQEEAGEQVTVGEPAFEVVDRDAEDGFVRGFLDPADDRLDLGTEPDGVGPDRQVGPGGGGDRPQQAPIAQARAEPQG